MPQPIDLEAIARRRARLFEAMQDGVTVIATAPEAARNRDTGYPYRFDSYFYYLTGFVEPDAVLVLISAAERRSILFCRDKDSEREIWDGFRYGPEAARQNFGVDEAYSIDLLDQKMTEYLSNRSRLYHAFGYQAQWDTRAAKWLNAVRGLARTGVTAPREIVDVRVILDEMRLVKDQAELAQMRRAADISAAAHRRAMALCRPGRYEYELEAELQHEFRRNGAQAPAYTPIVAAGRNACVLHYVSNDARIAAGDLVLIDAGCELNGYAADITRTFPAGGRFSAAQRAMYELVLAAQAAAIAAVRLGAGWNDPHDAAVRCLVAGMVEHRLLRGSVDGLVESGEYRRFYMHRTGHWLGLDVHDAGDYKEAGRWKTLRAGMVLTVEPGIYIRPGEGVPEEFWHIGIRIEDDALVTDSGADIITSAAPKQVADIEALVGQAAGQHAAGLD